ncbi:MAG: hypothetical protein IJK13_05620 [Lachnospiraceae bacterium]|nr:hypothetical protein [Lachnospiraceae bacterium]
MSKFIYCPISMSDHPYHVRSLDYNFYSLEELFYYYRKNRILIDNSIMEPDFIYWIRQQGEGMLAEKLTQIIKGKGTLIMYIEALLPYVNTFTDEEKQEFTDSIRRLEDKKEYERRKMLADQMLDRGRCQSAIVEYRRILDSHPYEPGEEEFLAFVWHNLGIAYAYLFRFDEASSCFKMAYSYSANEDTLEAVDFIEYAKDLLASEVKPYENDNFVHMLELSETRGLRQKEIRERTTNYLRSTM